MKLTDALMATAELCGTNLSEMAAELLLADLRAYPTNDVLAALSRCRRELKGRLTLAEVLARIDDGRPGADEAWVMLPWQEEQTAVLTEEMLEAMGTARHAYHAGDKVGARMAFKETYSRLVIQAREQRIPVQWQISLGWDSAGREGLVREAVQLGRITERQARNVLPVLPPADDRKALPAGEKQGVPMPDEVRKLIAAIGRTMPEG